MVVTRRNNARIAPAMPRKKLRVTKPVREFFQELGRRGGSKGGRRAALNMTPGYEPFLRRSDVYTPIYLSFVTLTTLGFGDVTPSTVPGRTLADHASRSGPQATIVAASKTLAR